MVDLVRRSSSLGRALFHISFKVKYSHKIFDYENIEQRCKEIIIEVVVVNVPLGAPI